MSIERREFKGNVAVSISANEVRVWVCNNQGQNILRIKATGKVSSNLNKSDIKGIEDQVDIIIG